MRLNKITLSEIITGILNFLWTILNIWGIVAFDTFYKSKLYEYKDIYAVANAIQIVKDPNYCNLFILGIVITVIGCLSILFSVHLIFSSETKLTKLSLSIFISLILINLVLSYFSIKYFLIGIVIVGIFAASITLATSD